MLSTVLLTLTVYVGIEALILFLIYRKFQKNPDFFKSQVTRFFGVDSKINNLSDSIRNLDDAYANHEDLEEQLNKAFRLIEELELEVNKTSKRTRRIKRVLVNRGIISKRTTKCVFPNARMVSGR